MASDKIDQVFTVPAVALQYRYGVNRVFVVKGDRLISREVKLGDRMGERVEVLDGVSPDESIVISDVEKLADGIRVEPERGE
jgi:multidrug efflux pump subunit AcrA (membrane-fusion protein)